VCGLLQRFLECLPCVRAAVDAAPHRTVGKDSGQTSRMERFNNTLRQHVSRLVRKALSFSKKVENHIGTMRFFIHHYHAFLA
jgi:IS1 family transposase